MRLLAALALPVLGLVLLAGGCGGSGPSGSTPPTPTPATPGMLTGAYELRVEPGPGCPIPAGSFSFLVTVRADTTSRHPGLQGVDGLPQPLLELELLDGGSRVRGALATTGSGIAAVSGTRVWLRLLGEGAVSISSTGAAEVRTGTAMGDLEIGVDADDEGGLGSCTSGAHTWSLRRP